MLTNPATGNLNLTGFTLTDGEVAAITSIRRRGGQLWNGDSDTIAFM